MINNLVVSRIGRDENGDIIFIEITMFDYKGSKFGTFNLNGDLFSNDVILGKELGLILKSKLEKEGG